MQNQLYPAHIIEFSKEQLLSESPRKTHIIYIIIILMFLAAIISLPLITVDVTVQGAGIIRPATEKQEVKSVISGFVEKIMIREGSELNCNESLIVINSDRLDEKITFLKQRIYENEKTESDLELLTFNFDKVSWDSLNTSLCRQEFNQFNNEIKKLKIKERSLEKDLAKLDKLYSGKMITSSTLENKQRELRQLNNDKKILMGKYLTKWQSDLKNMIERKKDLISDLAEFLKEKELYVVKTPVKGSVEQFQNVTVGTYVRAGETICVISPDSDLIAETYIYPKDIGLISRENEVNILIDSFNYNDWGVLKGEITDISNDFILVNNNPAFKIKCRLNKDFLQLRNGFKGKIKKGMTFQSRFVVSNRTLYQLLFDNVNDWLNPYEI